MPTIGQREDLGQKNGLQNPTDAVYHLRSSFLGSVCR